MSLIDLLAEMVAEEKSLKCQVQDNVAEFTKVTNQLCKDLALPDVQVKYCYNILSLIGVSAHLWAVLAFGRLTNQHLGVFKKVYLW